MKIYQPTRRDFVKFGLGTLAMPGVVLGSEERKRICLDPGLRPIIEQAEESGMRYAIEATYPNATNEKTAGELQALLINLSNSLFCDTEEHIRGRVVYEENGRYVFRE